MKDHETVPMIPLRAGSGVWLEDFAGKRYLDGISSWWVNLFGHANPRINAAVREQLDRLEHVIFAGFTHEPAVTLAEELMRIAPPGLNRCFFADNGSAAVEVAVKMSFHFWRNSGQPRKTRFITLANSYHGETLGALAVGDVDLYKAIYRPLLMDVITVPSPDAFVREAGVSEAQHARRMFAHMEAALAQHHDEVAAVIVEPLVQCAGGMRMYDPLYLKLLREACDRHGVHLIADEIAVGFGRTGTMFACEQAGIRPDYLCLSKGLTGGYLPLSAVLTTDDHLRRLLRRIRQAQRLPAFAQLHRQSAGLRRGQRDAGHLPRPSRCWSAIAPPLRRWRRSVAHLRDHPHVGGDPPARHDPGHRAGEGRAPRARPCPWEERRGLRIYRHALERGVLLRPLGTTLYFMPPYVIDERTRSTCWRASPPKASSSACA